MSLHALPSAEAIQALENQKRRSTITSIVIAFLSLTLLALLLAFIFLPRQPITQVEFRYYEQFKIIDPPIADPKITLRTKPASPSSAPMRSLLTESSSDLALPPIPMPVMTAESERAGVGAYGDDGWKGEGNGSGDGPFAPIQGILKNRCSRVERLALIEESGGDPKLDEHVVNALRFLKSTQAADGGWGTQHRSAMTALALLAYLGHCETPESEEFGESCLAAMVYLINQAKKQNGRLSGTRDTHQMPYEEAIATYALAEAYGMCRNMQIPDLRETVQAAGQFLIDQQHGSGGWDYGYEESSARGGDLSITGWHVQGLHACAATQLDYKNLETCQRNAVRYIETLQDQGGGFGYTSTKAAGSAPWHTLTGTGMLCLQMNGKPGSAAVRKAARYVLKSAPFSYGSADCDLYVHYYFVLVMF